MKTTTTATQTQATREQVRAAIEIVQAIAEAIRELGSTPSGVLYATVCGKMTISEYTRIIDILVRAGVVEDRSHMLVWVGPR